MWEVNTCIIDGVLLELDMVLANFHKDIVGISGRRKTQYSILVKKLAKHSIHDVLGCRVIAKNVNACYGILGVLQHRYNIIPELFKDYIVYPKNNGYQSIHATVIGILNQKVEIQIRTKSMNEIAENGSASHELYKKERYGNF